MYMYPVEIALVTTVKLMLVDLVHSCDDLIEKSSC